MKLWMRAPKVLVCGSCHWPWPRAVTAALDRLFAYHGDQLVVILRARLQVPPAAHN